MQRCQIQLVLTGFSKLTKPSKGSEPLEGYKLNDNRKKSEAIMKEIKAMIRPEKFEEVYRELRSKGYCCLTVYHGEGIGRRGDPDKLNASLEFPFLHSKIVKIEIVVADEQQDEVVNIIQQAASTNNKGDGIIYSSDIEKAMSIRTGKEGRSVL